MEIPQRAHPIWRDIITGKTKIKFDFIAARILQSALARNFARDPSPARLEKCACDLREFFVQNADQPMALKDIGKLSS